MNKIWLIAFNVFRRRIRSKGYLILSFAFPLLLAVFVLISALVFRQVDDVQQLGFVDETGRLASLAEAPHGERVGQMVPFAEVEDAEAAFGAGQIEAFIVIPPGYFEGERILYYGESPPSAGQQAGLAQRMRQAIHPEISQVVRDRLTQTPAVTYVSLEEGTEISSGIGLGIYYFTPAVLAFIFSFTVLFTTSQMGSAIVREKEQRSMEMIITSLKPSELIAGKVLGYSMLALTQIGIWILSGIIAAVFFFDLDLALQDLVIPWQALLWGLVFIGPGYLLYALLGAGAGIITGNNQQAEGVAGFIGFVAFVPFWFAGYFFSQPDSSLSVGLTLFPLTAPTVALLRMAFTEVPTWQLAASAGLLVLTLLLVVWFLAKIFRTTMLMYGQTAHPRHIWRALRGV